MKYFNFKKLTAMALTAIMAVSAMSVSAMAQEECDVETYAMSDENLDAEILDEAECAVFLIENDEIKQITPVNNADEESSAVIEDDNVLILSSDGEVTEVIPITADIQDASAMSARLGVKRTVTRDGAPLLSGAYAGADVILTLERGVAFWVDSYHGAYYYGCVKTGATTYTYGYILSSFVG